MGAACCVAAKDRTITCGTPGEPFQRQVHYSPSWSFRWDNRGRVAGEETSVNWLHDRGGSNDRLDVKSRTTGENAFTSDEGSPLNSFTSLASQKSPAVEGNSGILRLPSSDQSFSGNLVEMKASTTESPSVTYPSPVKLSPSAPTSPLSSQTHLLPPSSTPSRWHHRSPGPRLARQVSDTRIPEYKSPNFSISEEPSSFPPLSWGNDSDSWSIPSRRERWSFDSETSLFIPDKINRPNSNSSSRFPSFELQTCGVCAKLLTDRSSFGWGNQKIISTNVVAVVSVLTCGHVYHSECLECVTTEINKYDPSCPVCTFGEKWPVKMSEKVLKGEIDPRVRKRSRNRVVDSDLNGDDVSSDHHKFSEVEGKLSSSSSMKSSSGKPFLKRHFTFGSKSGRSLSVNNSTRRKGFFWARSSKN